MDRIPLHCGVSVISAVTKDWLKLWIHCATKGWMRELERAGVPFPPFCLSLPPPRMPEFGTLYGRGTAGLIPACLAGCLQVVVCVEGTGGGGGFGSKMFSLSWKVRVCSARAGTLSVGCMRCLHSLSGMWSLGKRMACSIAWSVALSVVWSISIWCCALLSL